MTDKVRFYLQLMSYFTLFLVGISLITVFYWTIKEYEPIKFNNLPFKVDVQKIKPGEYIIYTVDYCKNSKVVADVDKTFVDGIIYTIPKEPQPFLEEGCHSKQFFMYVPKALPPGIYTIKGVYTFQVNPLKKVSVYTETQKFEVLPR